MWDSSIWALRIVCWRRLIYGVADHCGNAIPGKIV